MKFLATKTFIKDDLEDGMVVEYANGERRLVVKGMLLGNDGYGKLEEYSDNLEYIPYPYYFPGESLRIDKVYSAHINGLPRYFDDRNLTLIWEREEPVKMTKEEIEEELGYKIEII